MSNSGDKKPEPKPDPQKVKRDDENITKAAQGKPTGDPVLDEAAKVIREGVAAAKKLAAMKKQQDEKNKKNGGKKK